MPSFSTLAALLVLVVSPAALAGGESLPEVFRSSFYSGEVHSLADCSSNVWRLIGRSVEAGADLSRAHVLYVLKPTTDDVQSVSDLRRLHPRHARFGVGAVTIPWVFHVVLENDGVIYDLDFHRAPRPLKTADYFAEMFSPAERRATVLRVISAEAYWRDYRPGSDESLNWMAYVFDTHRLYSLISLGRFESFGK